MVLGEMDVAQVNPYLSDQGGSKIRVGFCQFSWDSNHFIKEIPCHIGTASWHGQSCALLRSAVDHHALPELTFKDKTLQGMEHVCTEVVKSICGRNS